MERALHHISHGMYIITAEHDGVINAMIADAVMQVSAKPKMIATAINRENYTHDLIMKSGRFSVSILDTECPFTFIGKLGFRSGRDGDKCGDLTIKRGETGVPVIVDHTVGYLELEVWKTVDVYTHTLFIAELKNDVFLGGDEMTYRYYREVIKGKAPERAPTYEEE